MGNSDQGHPVVLKLGGRAAAGEALEGLLQEVAELRGRYSFILVHGGGAEVTRLSKSLGLEPVFKDGLRMTSPAEMEVVDMVLAGKMNKALVRRLQAGGVRAVGISGADGGLLTGTPVAGSRTGTVAGVDTAILDNLVGGGYLPVVATVASDAEGGGLNINADDAALAIAEACEAAALVYVSDIPGVMRAGEVLASLDKSGAARALEEGVITGGMIPKVQSSLKAVAAGVGSVVIGEFKAPGDLSRLLTGGSGTRIH